MGFIRGGLLIVVCALLFLSLLMGNVLLLASSSLQYDNVQSTLVSFAQDFFKGKIGLVEEQINLTIEMEEALDFMEEHCKGNSEYVFNEGGYTFVVPCDVVDKGPEAAINESINALVEDYYYKEYDCGFWDCFGEEELPLFLVSQKAKDYWKEKFYYALFVSLILIVLVFLLTERKQNSPILVGGLLILSSFPLLGISRLSSFIGGSYSELVRLFFIKASMIFLWVFILGLVILGLGIAWRFIPLRALALNRGISKKK